MRERFSTSGLKAPAWGESVPARRNGAFGAAAAVVGQGPPPGAAVGAKESARETSLPSGALQGVRLAVVVWVAQVGGVCSGARSPREEVDREVFERQLGGFLDPALMSWPVTGSGITSAANLATMPEGGSSITR